MHVTAYCPEFLLTLLAVATIPALLRGWDIGKRLALALDEAHLSRKEAAALLGIPEPQLSRAIAGQGPEHLSADRLTRLPRTVWLRLLLQFGEELGVAEDADTRAERTARRMARQLQAGLERDDAGVVHAA